MHLFYIIYTIIISEIINIVKLFIVPIIYPYRNYIRAHVYTHFKTNHTFLYNVNYTQHSVIKTTYMHYILLYPLWLFLNDKISNDIYDYTYYHNLGRNNPKYIKHINKYNLLTKKTNSYLLTGSNAIFDSKVSYFVLLINMLNTNDNNYMLLYGHTLHNNEINKPYFLFKNRLFGYKLVTANSEFPKHTYKITVGERYI